MDEELSKDDLDDSEDGIAFLALAIAGGSPSEEVQKLATEKTPMSNSDSLAGLVLGTATASTLTTVLGICIAGYLGRIFLSNEKLEVSDDVKILEPESDGIDPQYHANFHLKIVMINLNLKGDKPYGNED